MNDTKSCENKISNDTVDKISLFQLAIAVWEYKGRVIITLTLFAVLGVLFAKSLPDIYRADALLAPVEESAGGLGGMASQFGGLASLAGINLRGTSSRSDQFVEIIKSKAFIMSFIERHKLLVPLIASKSWDMDSNSLVIDYDVYDNVRSEWVREVKPPKTVIPSLLEGYERFMKLFSVTKDSKNGLVKLSLDFYSPTLVQEWLNLIISDINEQIRSRDILEAEQSIAYLQEQLGEDQTHSMESAFYQLIEQQTQTIMLAKVRKEYAFSVIDPAISPEKKV
ncbi:Wzz/FepE/Etk N-terminal domain-containing protein, partial [Oleiphilus sp. HI0123]